MEPVVNAIDNHTDWPLLKSLLLTLKKLYRHIVYSENKSINLTSFNVYETWQSTLTHNLKNDKIKLHILLCYWQKYQNFEFYVFSYRPQWEKKLKLICCRAILAIWNIFFYLLTLFYKTEQTMRRVVESLRHTLAVRPNTFCSTQPLIILLTMKNGL